MTDTSATVTIMFTDMVDSTALGHRLGDVEAKALRRAHDRLLEEQFGRFGGNVVESTGDGFLVTFSSARVGVECAVAIQRALERAHQDGRYTDLQVRIGVHTGEPVMEGGRLFGSDVNLAARVEAQAEGGQVLVSEVTRLLTRQTISREDPPFEFVPLGERDLKGFPEPVALFAVRWKPKVEGRPRLTRFVGREEESGLLRERLKAALAGSGSLVMVGGEPGVGKTRLVSELAGYAGDRGVQILTGHSYEAEGMPAYLPFVEALRQLLRSRPLDGLSTGLADNAPYVARLVPELRTMLPDVEEAPQVGADTERYLLFEGITNFLVAAARGAPLLLFLDDLHWADSATILLLQHLVRRVPEVPLLVIGTYRDVEVDDKHALMGLLAELARQRLGIRLRLRPFSRENGDRLVEAMLGGPPAAPVLEAIFSVTEGNAFFIEELVRHFQEQGRDLTDAEAAIGEKDIPESVRQVIVRRLAGLSPEANRLLAHSSVLGRDLTVVKVAAASEYDEGTVLDLLDEALGAHLVRAQGESYTFAHPLIREALYRELSVPRRRQLHQRAAEALERLYGPTARAEHLAELAHHFLEALPGGDVDKAVTYATRAAEHARSQLAYEEAAHLYEGALGALDSRAEPDPRKLCDLLLAQGEALMSAARVDRARHVLLRAAELARAGGYAEMLARAALEYGRQGVEALDFDQQLVGLIEEALEALGGTAPALTARLLAQLARSLCASVERAARERGRSLSVEALDRARALDDPEALFLALDARYWALCETPSIKERLAVSTEIVHVAGQLEDKAREYWAHDNRSMDLLAAGEMEEFVAEVVAMEGLAREQRQPSMLANLKGIRSMLAFLEGRFDEGEALFQETLRATEDLGGAGVAQHYLALVKPCEFRGDRGQLEQLETAIKGWMAGRAEARKGGLCRLAYLYCELGLENDARAAIGQLTADEYKEMCESELVLAPSMLARVSAYLGDKDRAERLYGALQPHAETNVTNGNRAYLGPVSRYLGLLAATLHRWEDAGVHFEDALLMTAKMRAHPWVALTQFDYAQMLLARDGPGDRQKAGGLLDGALETAAGLGMGRLVERASAARAAAQ